MELSIDHDNILRVDGKFLQVSTTSPDELFDILVEARWLIEQAIEEMYQKLAADPTLTVRRGSVWLMRLATDEVKVINPAGLQRDSVSQEDRGVFTDIDEVLPRFFPYWQAVVRSGLLPEGRRSHKRQPMNGFCLLAYLKNSR